MIWAAVSSQSCFCPLYRASPSLAAKNIINRILVLTTWWCPCIESSLVSLKESVCYDECILLAKLCLPLPWCKSPIIIHTSTLSWASLPSPYPTPLGHHRAPGWAPCVIELLLISYFIYGSVYMLMLLSAFVPFFPSLTMSISPFSISASSLLPCKWVHQYHFSRFPIYQRRQWHPTPVLLPGKSHGRRSLVGCSPWGR